MRGLNAAFVALIGLILLLASLAVESRRAAPSHALVDLHKASFELTADAGSFLGKTTHDPVAAFTFASVIVACAQACMFFWQLRLARTSAQDSRIAAQAAMKSAEAALASLDRPWLVLESVTHNKLAWARDNSPLFAGFRIHNYGKAPAFVLSAKADLFLMMRPENRLALAGVVLPNDYKEFPPPDGLHRFIELARSTLCANTKDWPPIFFDTAVVVPGGTVSQEFYCRYAPSRPLESLDVNADLVLIGQLRYHGPDEQFKLLSFCYLGGGDGHFQRINGPPYNETRSGDVMAGHPATQWMFTKM